MPQRRMKLVAKRITGIAAPIAARTTPLNHELRNHAVEGEPVVVVALLFLSRHGVDEFFRAFRQADEILDRFGCFLIKKFANDISQRGFKNRVRSSRSCHGSSLIAQFYPTPLSAALPNQARVGTSTSPCAFATP